MRFLCVNCDEQMKVGATEFQSEASLSIRYECPSCGHQVAMLTNASETQLVNSLGVSIGGGEAAADSRQASGCPFGEVVRGMGEQAGEDRLPGWTDEARSRLQKIPDFVRPMAKQGIEQYAQSKGYEEVDEKVLDEAKGLYGM